MGDQGAFDLAGAETVAGNVDNVIDAAHDPDITVFIFSCAIAGEVHILELGPVGVFVSLVVAVYGAKHGRPGFFDHKVSTLVGLARRAVFADDIHHDAGERAGCGSGFGRGRTG